MRAACRELDSMRSTGEIAPVLYEELRQEIDDRLSEADEGLSGLSRDLDSVRQRQTRLAARRLASAQKRAIAEALRAGRVGVDVARGYMRDLDLARREGEVGRAIEAEADLDVRGAEVDGPDRTDDDV